MVGEKDCASTKVDAKQINQIIIMVDSIVESAEIHANKEAITSKLTIVYRHIYDTTVQIADIFLILCLKKNKHVIKKNKPSLIRKYIRNKIGEGDQYILSHCC